MAEIIAGFIRFKQGASTVHISPLQPSSCETS